MATVCPFSLIVSLSRLGNPGKFPTSAAGASPKGSLKEFHISRAARKVYDVEEYLFTSRGNVVFPNFHAARVLAHRMNEKRDAAHFPEQSVRAGSINAMGLIDEILHFVVELYKEKHGGGLFTDAAVFLSGALGR